MMYVDITDNGGTVGLWSSQTDSFTFTSLNTEISGAIAGDGNVLAAGDYILNPQLIVSGEAALWDFIPFASNGFDFLNPTGSLLLQLPNTQSILVFDVNHGDLKEWVDLPNPVVLGSHTLTTDDTGQHLLALTSSGLNIIDFTFAPLSLAYVQPNAGPSQGGTSATLRGSGFQPNSQAFFNGTQATTSFVDSQTLSVVTPQIRSGPAQVSVTNADGQTYSLDNSFVAN